MHNLGLQWIEPGKAEEAAITSIVRSFLTPELELLRQVARGEKDVSR